MRIPGFTVGSGLAVWTHQARLIKLAEHNDNPAALHHAKGWRLTPEALVMKPHLVAVEVGGCHYIVNNEVGPDTPARPRSSCLLTIIPTVACRYAVYSESIKRILI